MRIRRISGLATILAACCLGSRPSAAQQPEMAPAAARPGRPFSWPEPDTATALHLLNRLSFGPRSGDIARVQQMGIERWLNEQLNPRRIDDPVQEAVRRQYAAAFESPAELYRAYPPPQLARRLNPGDTVRRRPNRAMPDSMAMMDQPPGDTMAAQQFARTQRRLGGDVVLATLARHAASERQLQEVMTDFWFNHFNVFIGKQVARWTTSDYVEHAIRPNALGRFEDLLKAVARHPAMLVYLDNAQSVAPGSQPPAQARRALQRQPDQVQRQMPTGLNENYARELLELHTLGVDGGYTQADVQNVARILTGWSIVGPGQAAIMADARGGRRDRFLGNARFGQNREPLTFEFHEWAHDRGAKVVLGVTFPAGHMEDEGQRLLEMLAQHPSTARHIAHKLCARLVADDAPDGCVDHAVTAWLRSHGDIAATVRAIVGSDDFWADANRRAKVKSPLEFLVSALRVTGAAPDSTPRLAGVLQQLGQPLFQQQVPTGYPETQEDWVNSGALLSRMNIAMGLAAGRMPGTTVDLDRVVPMTSDKDALIASVNAVILGGQASDNTLRVLRQQLNDVNDPRQARTMAVGLALGSPEFQKQ